MTSKEQKKRLVIEYIPTGKFNPSLEWFRQTISERIDSEYKEDFWASVNILKESKLIITGSDTMSFEENKKVSYLHIHNNTSFRITYYPLNMTSEDYKRLSEEISDIYKFFFYRASNSWITYIKPNGILTYIENFNEGKVFVKCINFVHKRKVVDVFYDKDVSSSRHEYIKKENGGKL